MPFYRMPNGDPYHINFGSAGSKKAPRPCGAKRADGTPCACMSEMLCDWKMYDIVCSTTRKPATCDRAICKAHAFEIGPDKHLCPEHVDTYRAWLRDQAIAY